MLSDNCIIELTDWLTDWHLNIRIYIKQKETDVDSVVKMDIFDYDKVVVDLLSNCLFMIMKLVACVTFPDGGRIRDGCLLLRRPQWTTSGWWKQNFLKIKKKKNGKNHLRTCFNARICWAFNWKKIQDSWKRFHARSTHLIWIN